MTVAESGGPEDQETIYSLFAKFDVRAVSHMRVNNHTNDSPAASSQEISSPAAFEVSQMANCSSSSDSAHKKIKAITAPGGTFDAWFLLSAIAFHDLVHALPRNVEFVRNLRNRQTVAAHFQDAGVALGLSARAALQRAPGPSGDFI